MFFHFQIELRYLVNVVAFQFQRLLNFRGMYCSTKDMIGVPRIMSQQLSMVIWHLTESTKQDNEHIFWHCFFVRSLWKAIFHRFSSLCFCPLHRRAVLVGNLVLFCFFFCFFFLLVQPVLSVFRSMVLFFWWSIRDVNPPWRYCYTPFGVTLEEFAIWFQKAIWNQSLQTNNKIQRDAAKFPVSLQEIQKVTQEDVLCWHFSAGTECSEFIDYCCEEEVPEASPCKSTVWTLSKSPG